MHVLGSYFEAGKMRGGRCTVFLLGRGRGPVPLPSTFASVASFLLSEPKNDARGNSCIVYVSARFPNV